MVLFYLWRLFQDKLRKNFDSRNKWKKQERSKSAIHRRWLNWCQGKTLLERRMCVKVFLFLRLEQHVVTNIPHKKKSKNANISVYVTFHLFLYSVFSNLLLKKRKRRHSIWRFHASEENFRKRQKNLFATFIFFMLYAFYAFQKNWKVISGSFNF